MCVYFLEDQNIYITTWVYFSFSGHLYVKSDVYGFGVVLLEIITGLRVLDFNRPVGQTNLINWAMPSLQNKKKFKKLIDPRLMGKYPSKPAYDIAELILQCLESDPKYRPSMDDVLQKLEQIGQNRKSKEMKATFVQDKHPKSKEVKATLVQDRLRSINRPLHSSHGRTAGGQRVRNKY